MTSAPAGRSGRVVWQLALTLWVGGVWAAHFVLLPALTHIGLAPLLVDDVSNLVRPIMLGFAAVCVVLQLVVLVGKRGAGFWRDVRGQLHARAANHCLHISARAMDRSRCRCQ